MSEPNFTDALSGHVALVVEDDGVSAGIAAAALSGCGAETKIARSGELALELIARDAPAVVICDVGLPDANGVEIASQARATNPGAAIVMVSGDTTFETAVAAIRAGADDYLPKPATPDEMVEKVLTALDRRAKQAPRRRVLAVGAHPDDVEIGCGGLLLAHSAAGDEVTILTLSQGAQGGDPALRGRESRAAAELIDATLIMADLEDTAMGVGQATIDPIIDAIASSACDVVYTHTNRDVHQDHRAVHNATLVAAREISQVLTYQAPSTSVDFLPTRFIDIEAHLDRKIELIDCYATQAGRPYLDPELIRSTARYWARFARGTRYVEPLEVVRDAAHAPANQRVASGAAGAV